MTTPSLLSDRPGVLDEVITEVEALRVSREDSIVDTVMKRGHGRWGRRVVLNLVNDSKGVTDELRRIDALHIDPVVTPS